MPMANPVQDPTSLRHPREGMSIAGLLDWASGQLSDCSDSPRLDSEVLLRHCLSCPRSHLFAYPEKIPSPQQQAAFAGLVHRRRQQEPVAYLTGTKEFWSLSLQVNDSTLIPRPESEALVALALSLLPADSDRCIADLGTGSGAIALALAHERPRWQVVATDICPDALTTARDNARALSIDNIDFQQGDWCQALPASPFDLIISNPPYIAAGDPAVAAEVARYEPATALYADGNGFACLERIAATARQRLRTDGWLLLEHGYRQADEVAHRLRQYGYHSIQHHQDLNGHTRIVCARWRPSHD